MVQDRYLLPAMTGGQLRLAITGPARMAGSQVDDELAQVLLAEVRARRPGDAGAGVLPLLSHALDQAWRSRAGEALTLADYERTGGIEAAVAASAERAYGQLTAARQEEARRVFTRLAAASADGADTADRATRAELTEGKTPGQVADVEAVLEAFAAERLLTLAADSVEISHEVLLTAWPLLRDSWLAETRADRVVRTRLRATAADWERRARDPSYLYTAAPCCKPPPRPPAGSPSIPPATRRSARLSVTSCRPAVVPAAAPRAGGRQLSQPWPPLPWPRRPPPWPPSANAGQPLVTRRLPRATRPVPSEQHAIALSRQLAADSLAAGDSWTARQLAVAAWSISPTSEAST